MELGFIGLGKMGMNMVTRLRQGGHRIVDPDRSPRGRHTGGAGPGSIGAASLSDPRRT